MTLRLRLVLGLVVLVLAGLAAFGYSTYALYSRSQYDSLDTQIRNSLPAVAAELYERAEFIVAPGFGGRTTVVPFGTYAELRNLDRSSVNAIRTRDIDDEPALPMSISDPGPESGRLFTVGSTAGDGEWRVLLTRAPGVDSYYILIATPTGEVVRSLDRFLVIEAVSIGGLIVLLAIGSWLILRRGLRPLEQMATATAGITAGDLSQRVEPADGRTEVGQLGLALNTMLGELETSFKQRDATERRLRQFLADASHELRTPLTSIQGFAELSRVGADHPDLDRGLMLARIEEESARMRVLVEDLLTLARLDEPTPTARSDVDLAIVAADACSNARAIGPTRSLTLHAPAPVVVDGNAAHLRQAVGNLVTNAVHHTPDGGSIEVVVDHDAEASVAIVAVRDHGPGLTAAGLAHAFDRFWRADSARVGSGSGLGLSIVASVAAEHGGTATVANAPDGGAVFTLRLPLR